MIDPPLMAWAAVGIALGGYLHYTMSVTALICNHLGISCLTIPVHDEDAKKHN